MKQVLFIFIYTMRYKKGNRWKSGKDKLKYRVWRKNVFALNFRKRGLSRYYVCEKCNVKRKTTRIFHAHHIKSWHKFPEHRYDKLNAVVMCKICHNRFHKKYGYKAIEDPKLIYEYLK